MKKVFLLLALLFTLTIGCTEDETAVEPDNNEEPDSGGDDVVVPPAFEGANYYLDSVSGDDSNDGLSEASPWKTLTNANTQVFEPSDSIFFKKGGVWTGSFKPQGSGVSGSPIVVTSYGDGDDMPLLDGNGLSGTGTAVVVLYDIEYWEVSDLEIVNDATSSGNRRGVYVYCGSDEGVLSYIHLKRLYIHNIKGQVGQTRDNKRTSGIALSCSATRRYDDFWIDGCVIHDCDNQGIITEHINTSEPHPVTDYDEWYPMRITNARITNNLIYNISKNAMIIRLFDGGVVEHNLCHTTAIGEDFEGMTGNTMFTAACYQTVFQYNEGYNNMSPEGEGDGSLYDADLDSPGTIWQYSYSHDNAHGLFWACTTQDDSDIKCRYNVSYNDAGIIFCVNYPVTSIEIYNNTVIVGPDKSPIIISERGNGGSGTRNYTFHNNIIYNQSETTSYLWYSGSYYSKVISHNCFYGPQVPTQPSDLFRIADDPLLKSTVLAGSISEAGTLDGALGAALTAGSPCIDAGLHIEDNGGLDYAGNPLYNGAPDIGAFEYYDDAAAASPAAHNALLSMIDDYEFNSNPLRPNAHLEIVNSNNPNYDKHVNIKVTNPRGEIVHNANYFQGENYALGAVCTESGLYNVTVTSGPIKSTKKLWVM